MLYDDIFRYDWVKKISPKKLSVQNYVLLEIHQTRKQSIKNSIQNVLPKTITYIPLAQEDNLDQTNNMKEDFTVLEKNPPLFIKTKINDFNTFCVNINKNNRTRN